MEGAPGPWNGSEGRLWAVPEIKERRPGRGPRSRVDDIAWNEL